MDDLMIREILELVPKGQIRVPAFQRGFVWDPDRVAFLMDSIYKGYPFGSLLLWRTREQLRFERQLGPYALPDKDPDLPIDYVLDGQQRITAIFGVFQSELPADPTVEWADIYFDLAAEPDAQESQFLALHPEEVDLRRHFPLKTLFLSIDYRRATEKLGPDDVVRVDKMQERFKEARIPIALLRTEDRAKVAIVFERINRMGVPLDTLQLLTAWTWSEEFHLQHEFNELREELAPFGFAGLGEDSNILLRCCSAVVAGDAAPNTLVKLRGADVRDHFGEIANGVKGAVDFLRNNLQVQTIENLPFSTLLVPLSVFFAVPGNEQVGMTDSQRKRLIRWFWRSCFSRRFSSGVLRNLKADIDAMKALKNNQPSTLSDFQIPELSKIPFILNSFKINSVNTKTFILLLAQQRPLNFISGQPVPLGQVLKEYNSSEFHHLFPRSYLVAKSGDTTLPISAVANFAFISKVDNNALGGGPPSSYRGKMPPNADKVLQSALCPELLFKDDYVQFLNARAELLAKTAASLMA